MSEKEIPLMDRQKPVALRIGYRLEQTAPGNLIDISCRFGFFALFVINLYVSGAIKVSELESPVKHD